MKLLARLAVYAAALFVVVTARLPGHASSLSALRATSPGPTLDPVRLMIGAVLLTGIACEFLRRRTIWH
jgi:hypothetical protein